MRAHQYQHEPRYKYERISICRLYAGEGGEECLENKDIIYTHF